MERRQRIRARLELELHADAERGQREAEAGSLQELLDPRPDTAAQLRRVRALQPDGDVRQGQDAEEIDEDRDHSLAAFRLLQHAAQQARLAVLARRVEPDVVPADRRAQQLGRLVVPVDQVFRWDRPRVDERVGVGDHVLTVALAGCFISNLTVALGSTCGLTGAHQRARARRRRSARASPARRREPWRDRAATAACGRRSRRASSCGRRRTPAPRRRVPARAATASARRRSDRPAPAPAAAPAARRRPSSRRKRDGVRVHVTNRWRLARVRPT